MERLRPTPELVATAERVATGGWTLAVDDPGYPTDPLLAALVDAGYAVCYFPPTRLRDDYWTLTAEGREWLAWAKSS